MAMNANVLGQAIANAVIDSNCPQQLRTQLTNKWIEIAGIIISHIQNYATVSVTVASVSGVTPGSGVSGAGTGTGTIS